MAIGQLETNCYLMSSC